MADFDFYQSGALLALNTFGPYLLACASLPLVCLSGPQLARLLGRSQAALHGPLQPGIEPVSSKTWEGGRSGGASAWGTRTGSDGTACDSSTPASSIGVHARSIKSCARMNQLRTDEPCMSERLLGAALVFVTCRSLTAVAATASAAIQRRHLMVWALFAPKFLFEAVTLLICDVMLLVIVLIFPARAI